MPPHALTAKCSTCYLTDQDTKLQYCSRCKAVKYCSRECQKKDWKSHKASCNYNTELSNALYEHSQTPLGVLDRLLLPDNMSIYDLDKRLEKFVKYHQPLLMNASLHGLQLPLDINRARTHVLHIKLIATPRAHHGDNPGKYFKVQDAFIVAVEEAMKWEEPWPLSLKKLKELQDDSEKNAQGAVACSMVECKPLSVQVVPYGSVKRLKGLGVVKEWKSMLIQDVEIGKKFTGFS